MSKKIALVLIMVMLVNMIAWAEDSADEGMETFMVVLALVGLAALLIGVAVTVEAEAPDDGIRMASMPNEESVPKTGFTTFLNLLQHVEIGQVETDKFYAGLHFRY